MRVTALAVLLSFLSTTPAFPCKASSGKTTKDREFAAGICKIYEENADIQSVWFNGPTMGVNISERLYRGLRADRVSADKVVRDWIGVVQATSKMTAVSVYVFWDNTKVIEGDVNWKAEKVVKFLRP